MASLLFDDIDFPTELYVQETGEFATPVRTLLQFAPHILENLPKSESEQEPIHPKETDEHLRNPQASSSDNQNSQAWWSGWLKSGSTKSLAEQSFTFCLDMARMYMEQTQWQENRETNRDGTYGNSYKSSNTTKKESDKKKEGAEEEKAVDSEPKKSTDYSSVVTAAAGVSALTLSLYSTYRLSSTIGQVTFHNQLNLLLEHVESILETTRFWMKEQVDPIPPIVKKDVERIEKLVDLIHRLDSRSEKKTEATAWAAGALGSLGLLGGVAVGSTIALGGGAVVALGGLFYGVYSKAQFSTKQYASIREMLESEVREIVRQIDEKNHSKKLIDQFRQVRPKVYNMPDFPKIPTTDPYISNPGFAQQESFSESTTNKKHKDKTAQASWL